MADETEPGIVATLVEDGTGHPTTDEMPLGTEDGPPKVDERTEVAPDPIGIPLKVDERTGVPALESEGEPP